MEPGYRWRLNAIIGLLAVIAAGVLGLAWKGGAIEATATIFVLGALIAAAVRRPPDVAPESEGE